jgi:hypothetical protein
MIILKYLQQVKTINRCKINLFCLMGKFIIMSRPEITLQWVYKNEVKNTQLTFI